MGRPADRARQRRPSRSCSRATSVGASPSARSHRSEALERRGGPTVSRERPPGQRPLYAGYVLILVLGLRRGEALGLGWNEVDIDAAELRVALATSTRRRAAAAARDQDRASDARLPFPDDLHDRARAHRPKRQDQWRAAGNGAGRIRGSVFTTRYGAPVEPRNFHRDLHGASQRPVFARSRAHHAPDLRLAARALDVHPRVAMPILRHSQIRGHDGRLHRGLRRGNPGRADGGSGSSWTDDRCCTLLLYSAGRITDVTGIGPLTWVELRGIEPLTPRCERGALPTAPQPRCPRRDRQTLAAAYWPTARR